MEAAGLAFGVLGILSCFNTVVMDIRLIKDCQAFEGDYETIHLKIELAEARIVRWGTSLGIANHDPPPETIPASAAHNLVPEHHRRQAEETLQAIKNQLKIAKKKMLDFESKEKDPSAGPDKSRQGSLSKLFRKHPAVETQESNSKSPKSQGVSTLIE